jgi:hypothetical protein
MTERCSMEILSLFFSPRRSPPFWGCASADSGGVAYCKLCEQYRKHSDASSESSALAGLGKLARSGRVGLPQDT